jgi:PAS domain S-box-containing protein
MLVNGETDYAIFMLSPDRIVTNWNAGARRIKGYSAEEIIGSHFSRFYTREDAASGLPQRGLSIAATEDRFEAEGWRVRKRSGRTGRLREDHARHYRAHGSEPHAHAPRSAGRPPNRAIPRCKSWKRVGKLTGGVAHDFNNVLQMLRGNLCRTAGP